MVASTSLLRQVPGKDPDRVRPDEVAGAELSDDTARTLVCAACHAIVTNPSQRINVQGQHEHTVSNPAGFVYRIGCYSEAFGARSFGAPSEEHTWFKGYAWQMAVCHGCGEHLGWCFTGAGSCFWALIAERLREVGSSRA